MASPPMKRSSSPSQTLTLAGGTPEALVRDAMRSAALASAPLPPVLSPPQLRFGPAVEGIAVEEKALSRVLCCEEIDGRRWNYVMEVEGPGGLRWGSALKAVSLQTPAAPIDVSFFISVPFYLFSELILLGLLHLGFFLSFNSFSFVIF